MGYDRTAIRDVWLADWPGLGAFVWQRPVGLKAADGMASALFQTGVEIIGTNGSDTLRGGTHDDTLRGQGGDDLVYGFSGNDSLYGGGGADLLSAGDGNDVLYGDAGDDTLAGGLGNDTLHGGAGNDLIAGGDGTDVAVFDHAFSSAVVTRDGDTFIVSSQDGVDRLIDVERIAFSDVTITTGNLDVGLLLVGTNGSDALYGEGSDDMIFGFGGADWLDGGAGNDIIGGGAGDDTLLGGSGNDILLPDGDDLPEDAAFAFAFATDADDLATPVLPETGPQGWDFG